MTAFFFVLRSVKFVSLPWRAEISVNLIATLYIPRFFVVLRKEIITASTRFARPLNLMECGVGIQRLVFFVVFLHMCKKNSTFVGNLGNLKICAIFIVIYVY